MKHWMVEYEDTQSGMTRYAKWGTEAREKAEAIQKFNEILGNMPGIYILGVREVTE